MKKESMAVKRDFSKYDDTALQYYGILMKEGRARIDTKRFKLFFPLPDEKIEYRQTVYYLPSRKHYSNYICNIFKIEINKIKNLWINEYSKAIKLIKTPKQVEDDSRLSLGADGILEADEVKMCARISGIQRNGEYRLVIKSLYAQFFHQMMSDIDALSLRVVSEEGYDAEDFTKKQFDSFIMGKQGKKAIEFKKYKNYAVYDEAYRVWNFLKHNSLKSYSILKRFYPNRIYDPDKSYENGQSALSVLKLDERYIIYVLDNICLFFDEVCRLAFKENTIDAKWDYDDYFINLASGEIDEIRDPLGLPKWL